jgi:AraC family transcriptional regulator
MRFGINLPWSDVGTASALMTGRVTRDYVVREYRTPLSIKAVAAGQARYETPQGRYLVTPDVFLLLNDGQQYDMDVPAAWGTTTLCPFFAGGFVEAAVASARASEEKQLDGIEAPPIEFCERLYPMTGAVAAALRRAGVDAGATSIEDVFHDLAAALAALRDDVRRDMARFPAVRLATREELYRRLHRARDFIASCYAEPLSVADVARVAAMSPFHLHRAFKRAFGVTPMRFLQSRRLHAAKAMLVRGARVTDVCFAVGFESLGSFSALYRRRFGAPPSKEQS